MGPACVRHCAYPNSLDAPSSRSLCGWKAVSQKCIACSGDRVRNQPGAGKLSKFVVPIAVAPHPIAHVARQSMLSAAPSRAERVIRVIRLTRLSVQQTRVKRIRSEEHTSEL